MFLAAKIVQNFINSLDEKDIVKIQQMNDGEALDYICELYEIEYGAKPSGVAMYLIKSKFKLSSVDLAMQAAA